MPQSSVSAQNSSPNLPHWCLVHTADTNTYKTRLSCVLSVSAVWTELVTSQDCRQQKISKLFCSVSKCGEDYWRQCWLVVNFVRITDKKRKGKKKENSIDIAPLEHKECSQSGHAWITQFYLQITPCVPFLRSRSLDGATPDWGSVHPIAAYYPSIDPEGMKGWVGLVDWPIANGLLT